MAKENEVILEITKDSYDKIVKELEETKLDNAYLKGRIEGLEKENRFKEEMVKKFLSE